MRFSALASAAFFLFAPIHAFAQNYVWSDTAFGYGPACFPADENGYVLADAQAVEKPKAYDFCTAYAWGNDSRGPACVPADRNGNPLSRVVIGVNRTFCDNSPKQVWPRGAPVRKPQPEIIERSRAEALGVLDRTHGFEFIRDAIQKTPILIDRDADSEGCSQFPAYTLTSRSTDQAEIYICLGSLNRWSPAQLVRTIIHETFHVAGYGEESAQSNEREVYEQAFGDEFYADPRCASGKRKSRRFWQGRDHIPDCA